jgi:hypothetical protein
VDADESPFARTPEPGIHETRSALTQPQADVAAAGAAAQSIRRFPLVVRIALVTLAILFVVGFPLALLLTSN